MDACLLRNLMALMSQEHKHVKIQLPFVALVTSKRFLGVVWSIRPYWVIWFTDEEHKTLQMNDSEAANLF